MSTLCKRIRRIRVSRNLSQGDVERSTGLRRQYVSRVENGRTMPSIETLEKLAAALKVPLYRLFYDGVMPANGRRKLNAFSRPGRHEDPHTRQLLRMLLHIKEPDRQLLLATVQKMAQLQRAA